MTRLTSGNTIRLPSIKIALLNNKLPLESIKSLKGFSFVSTSSLTFSYVRTINNYCLLFDEILKPLFTDTQYDPSNRGSIFLENDTKDYIENIKFIGLRVNKNLYSTKYMYCENIETIKEYKTGDIIKKMNQYYSIEYIELKYYSNSFHVELNIKNLISKESINIPFTQLLRPMKIYNLSDRIKERLETESRQYTERLQNLKQNIGKQKIRTKSKEFKLGVFNKYRGKKKCVK